MLLKSVWEEFFDHHAPRYMENSFTRNTVKEVDFILEELRLPTGSHVLDVGCGTGRHAIELAGRGFRVTGIDLSAGMLEQAKTAAVREGVEIELIKADATSFHFDRRFDAALCLCEGAFSLLETTDDPLEHDLAILRSINTALKNGAQLILTVPNGLRKIREYKPEDVTNGRFDPFTIVEIYEMEYETPDGRKMVTVREKGYLATELRMMLSQTGFHPLHFWGGTAGKWGRRPLELDEVEIMAVARKKE